MTFFSAALKKFLTTITLIGYLGFGVLGFLHVLHMEHMHTEMIDCPFLHTLHDLGQTTLTSHLQITEVPLVTFITFAELFLFAIILFFVTTKENTEFFTTTKCRYLLKHQRRERHKPDQHLFSEGILNSKAF